DRRVVLRAGGLRERDRRVPKGDRRLSQGGQDPGGDVQDRALPVAAQADRGIAEDLQGAHPEISEESRSRAREGAAGPEVVAPDRSRAPATPGAARSSRGRARTGSLSRGARPYRAPGAA